VKIRFSNYTLRSKLRNLLAPKSEKSSPEWLQSFATIDSTNNYAMQKIADGLARHGDVIWALHQTNGRGQRGRRWMDSAGENLAFSIILLRNLPIHNQFVLSASVAWVIATYLKTILASDAVSIKWPNDIYINDKKACGILIENVFKGMDWSQSVVGIGLNVNQTDFSADIARATSLKLIAAKSFDLQEIIVDLRAGILNSLHESEDLILKKYNQLLYKKNTEVDFIAWDSGRTFTARVKEVSSDGRLVLEKGEEISYYRFGSLSWLLD
jgi:BirA family biotin operon repressor/biotin-[acetyl-CoA-carboxylase] ligase